MNAEETQSESRRALYLAQRNANRLEHFEASIDAHFKAIVIEAKSSRPATAPPSITIVDRDNAHALTQHYIESLHRKSNKYYLAALQLHTDTIDFDEAWLFRPNPGASDEEPQPATVVHTKAIKEFMRLYFLHELMENSKSPTHFTRSADRSKQSAMQRITKSDTARTWASDLRSSSQISAGLICMAGTVTFFTMQYFVASISCLLVGLGFFQASFMNIKNERQA